MIVLVAYVVLVIVGIARWGFILVIIILRFHEVRRNTCSAKPVVFAPGPEMIAKPDGDLVDFAIRRHVVEVGIVAARRVILIRSRVVYFLRHIETRTHRKFLPGKSVAESGPVEQGGLTQFIQRNKTHIGPYGESNAEVVSEFAPGFIFLLF